MALRLTAVATTLDFIDIDYCTRSMFSLTKNISIGSSLNHFVATANVVTNIRSAQEEYEFINNTFHVRDRK